jgi:hypothetical protein
MAGKVEGLDELVKQIGRIGAFPKEMSRELRKANRSIGSLASKAIKPQIPRSRRVFEVRRSGARGGKRGPNMDIQPGTLRRSIGVRNSKGSRINVFIGPRFGGVAERNDGWFASIVEGGHVGGRNRSIGSPAFNKIAPALARLSPIMERLMVIKYRRIFDKYKL